MIAYSHECSDNYHTSQPLTKKEIAKIRKKEKKIEKIKKEMEKIFKASCYTSENDWIKPRDFDDIMEDVIEKTINYLEKISLL